MSKPHSLVFEDRVQKESFLVKIQSKVSCVLKCVCRHQLYKDTLNVLFISSGSMPYKHALHATPIDATIQRV